MACTMQLPSQVALDAVVDRLERLAMTSRPSFSVDESSFRQEIRLLLEVCIRKQLVQSLHTRHKTEEIARSLEEMLYKSAQSLAEYCDKSTLESRLRVILRAWRHEKTSNHQRRGARRLAKRQRDLFLQHRMGLPLYEHAKELVSLVILAQNELVGSSCQRCRLINPDNPTTRTFGKHLPEEVQDLFFRSPLVDAFLHFSVQRLHSVEWDSLVQQTEAKLHSYEDWKARNFTCSR